MSYLTAEQMMAAQRANLDVLFGLTEKAFAGVEKLVDLNLRVAKAAMSEAADSSKTVLSIKDAQELLALQQSLLQPVAEKAAAYGRSVYEITAATNAEVTKIAEAQMADAQKKFMAVVDGAVKNAPAGTENAVSLMKSAVSAANNAFESVQKAAKQAANAAEANMQAMTSTAAKASQAPKGRRGS